MRDKAWKRRAAVLLSLVAGCDVDRATIPSPPLVAAGVRGEEPRLGPVRSYAGVPDLQLLEAFHDGTERAGVVVTSVEEEPFFVYAFTMVGITRSGRRSNGNVVARSGTNTNTLIRHSIRIALTTPEGARNFPEVLDHSSGTFLNTIVPISGINCTTEARLSAETTHRAGGFVTGMPETAFSLGDASCSGNDACEPDDEPPTQVAPGPSEPGYDPGGGGGGNGGGDCGDNPGGTNPPSSGCHDEYVYVEVSNDGGVTWIIVWEGWAVVCV